MTEPGTEQEVEKLRQELARLREELAALAARRTAGDAGSAAGAETGTDWSSVRHSLDEAQARGEKALKDLSEQIKLHPVGSAVTAFGLGFFVALLLGGGRRS
jgi:hypothetical protein